MERPAKRARTSGPSGGRATVPLQRRLKRRAYAKRRTLRKKPVRSTIGRLVRQVRRLNADQYEKQYWHYNWGTSDQLEIVCDPIIASPNAWYRVFAGASDSPVTQKAWLNKVKYDYRYQITNNTPTSHPIYLTMFFVSPKWAYRQTQSATTVTLLNASQLTGDVHYSYTGGGPASPMLNKEMFYIHKIKRIMLTPNVNTALGVTTVATDPRHSFRKGSVTFSTKLMMEAVRNSSWASVPLEDLPFTKQIYVITFCKFEAAQPQNVAGVKLQGDFRTFYSVNQVA